MSARFYTTNYDDFKAMVNSMFGDVATVFCGTRSDDNQEFTAIATDRTAIVVYKSVRGQPDDFNNNFTKARGLVEIHRLELG